VVQRAPGATDPAAGQLLLVMLIIVGAGLVLVLLTIGAVWLLHRWRARRARRRAKPGHLVIAPVLTDEEFAALKARWEQTLAESPHKIRRLGRDR